MGPYVVVIMGVDIRVIKEGNGPQPQKGQTVTVHCTGKLADGKKFWSTHDTNEPFSFQIGLRKVILGWDEGVMNMKVGETSELTCSPDYAYGAGGFPSWGIPPNAVLKFEIELLKIQ